MDFFSTRKLEKSGAFSKRLLSSPALREPRGSWILEIAWVPCQGSTLGLQLQLGIKRVVPIGSDPRRPGAEALKLTLLWPFEFWICSSFLIILSPKISRVIVTKGSYKLVIRQSWSLHTVKQQSEGNSACLFLRAFKCKHLRSQMMGMDSLSQMDLKWLPKGSKMDSEALS